MVVKMISVIFLVCNCEDSLNLSINSILNQAFQDFELICIDVCSNDSSLEILKNFKMLDKRIKVISCEFKENLSVVVNDAIFNAAGEYIYFLDSEFSLNRNAFDILYNLSIEHDLDCVIFNYNVVNENSDYLKFDNCSMDFQIFEDSTSSDFLFKFPVSKGNNFISKSFLLENVIIFRDNLSKYFYKMRFNSKRSMILYKSLANVKNSCKGDLKIVLNNFKLNLDVFNWFFKNKDIYEYYKIDLLNFIIKNFKQDFDYISKYSNNPSNFIEFNRIKNEYYNQLICLFDKFNFDYNIYEDIKNSLDNDLLNFFNQFSINKNKYRLSIIVPIYNGEKFLKNSLDSILNQTLNAKTIEVILVDDHSTDNSSLIINEYCQNNVNFKSIFLDKNSSYAGRPRNMALEQVKSRYVTFLDADDYYYSNALENLYYSMICNDCDIVIGNFTMDSENGEKIIVKDNGLTLFENLNEYSALKFDNPIKNPHIFTSSNVWNKLFKLEIIQNNFVKFPEGVPAEDSGFLFQYLLNSNNVLFINKSIIHYHNLRISDDDKSVSHIRNKLNVLGRIKVYMFMYNESVEYNIETLFIKNLLLPKLFYWLSQFIETDLSNDEVINIFKEYKILFVKCYSFGISSNSKWHNIFKFVSDSNFENLVHEINSLKYEN